MFTLNHFYRDEFGKVRSGRFSMRTYKNEALAKRKADEIRGGFVCRLGSNNITYMGSWTL